jgi:hypothetical protein
MKYTIDGDIARIVGANAALVHNHVVYWVDRNRKAKKGNHNGETWMFDSYTAMAKHFGFLTQHQVRRCMDKLIQVGMVKTTCAGFDRTAWYTTTSEIEVLDNGIETAVDSNWQKRQMDVANMPKGVAILPNASGNSATSSGNSATWSGKSANPTLYKDRTKIELRGGDKPRPRPTLEEVTEAFQKKGHPTPLIIAETFMDHYGSNGWKVGRNTMKSWPHAVGTWMKREKQTNYAKSRKGFNGSNFTANAAVNFINHG